MELSHYLKIYTWEEDPGYLLLYSTKRTSKILLKKEDYQAIERGILSSSDEKLLSGLGMIVADQEEEKRDMLAFLDRFNVRNSGLHLIVVLNLDCNFACLYCYEGDMKGKWYMSDEVARQLIEFIKHKFTDKKKTLLIDFYGGEPLLSTGLIKSISQVLKSFAEDRGASYWFTLVTNGSLFKRQVAEELVPLGLTNVKITLDGPAKNHNRYRPFKSGAGSFGTIINNIKETWDLVKIGIGGNYDQTNYKKFVSLLNYLAEEGLTHERISAVKFDPIMKRPVGDTSPVDYKEGCLSINEPWLLDADSFLREEILNRGYNTLKPMPMSCMVEIRDSYVVDFDGCIYKCPGFIGKKGYEVGDLIKGVTSYESTYKVGIYKNERCAECEYLPLCFGGCRYMAFLRDGNLDNLDCKKPYLDASLEAIAKSSTAKKGPLIT